jgi:hypothetical protein
MFELRFDPGLEKPVVRRLRGQDAFAAVARALVRFAIDDRKRLSSELDRIALFTQACRIYELSRPRRLNALSESVEVIIETLGLRSGSET